MYANVPFCQKLILSWQIIPVYFTIFEVSFCVNHYIIFKSNSSTKQIITFLLFNPLALMTLITHIKSMFTNPGYVPIPNTFSVNSPISIDNNSFSEKTEKNNNIENKNDPELYCNKCHNNRPPRAHHCRVCKKCTLKMDHHCHWIANCVGYYNQKNFYQFLFYSTIGDIVGFLFLFFEFLNCDKSLKNNVPKNVKINSAFELFYYMWTPINLLIGTLCALSMSIGIGTIFIKQTKMLLNNQTTIDKKKYYNWRDSPFYERDKMKSFKSVMGKTVFDWFQLEFDTGEIKKAKKVSVLESR